jgi:hypothetical protein
MNIIAILAEANSDMSLPWSAAITIIVIAICVTSYNLGRWPWQNK